MSQTIDRTVETAVRHSGRRRLGRSLMLIALAAVTGVIVWMVVDGGPVAGFDGEAASYSGPERFTAGEVTFTLNNTDLDNPIAFVLGELKDPAPTLTELQAYAEDQPASLVPAFLASFEVFVVQPDDAAEWTVSLSEGTWWLAANTSPTDTDQVHHAAVVEVASG